MYISVYTKQDATHENREACVCHSVAWLQNIRFSCRPLQLHVSWRFHDQQSNFQLLVYVSVCIFMVYLMMLSAASTIKD
jgi:hypothetical protein